MSEFTTGVLYVVGLIVSFFITLALTRYVFRVDNIITLLAAILEELKKNKPL